MRLIDDLKRRILFGEVRVKGGARRGRIYYKKYKGLKTPGNPFTKLVKVEPKVNTEMKLIKKDGTVQEIKENESWLMSLLRRVKRFLRMS